MVAGCGLRVASGSANHRKKERKAEVSGAQGVCVSLAKMRCVRLAGWLAGSSCEGLGASLLQPAYSVRVLGRAARGATPCPALLPAA